MSSADSTKLTRIGAGTGQAGGDWSALQPRLLHLINRHPGVGAAATEPLYGTEGRMQPVAYITPHPARAAEVAHLLAYRDRGLLAGQKQATLSDGTVIVHHNKGETEFVYSEIFGDNCYFRHGISLQDGNCVFDVGANIGLFSLYMARASASLDIFAFEPLPPTHLRLDTNRIICGMHNVRTFSYGLSDKAGAASFTYYARNSIMSGRYADAGEDGALVRRFLTRQRDGAGGACLPADALLNDIVRHSLAAQHFDCQLRTLSDVIAEHRIKRIDLLKVDVEKSELDVLRGIRDEDWPKIRQVVAEVYDGDDQLAIVYRLLRRHGFRPVVEQDASLRGTKVYMVYAIRHPLGHGARPRASYSPRELPPWRNNPALLAEDVQSYLRGQLPEGALPRIEVVHALPAFEEMQA